MLLHQDADYADDPGSDAEQPAASMPASWAALAIFEDEDVSAAANAAASSAASASASNAAIVTAATVATAAKQESVVFQASDGVLVDADAIAEASDGVLVPAWLQCCASTVMEDGRIKPCSKQQLSKLFSDGSPPTLLTTNSPLVALCMTCLGRGWQLKLSLPLNLALAWRFRAKCTFFLAVFDEQSEDSQNLLRWINENLQPALECGLLKIALGELRFWDCSIGKNTAHMFAIKEGGQDQYLVNLDGDNVMKDAWLPWLFHMLVSAEDSGGAHSFAGDGGGCTGRLGIWARPFLKIASYEESLPYPSGYEDIEILHRSEELMGFKPRKYRKQKQYPGCGYSIPNDADPKIALAAAKVIHCDPARCGTLTWGQQNTKNMDYCNKLRGRRNALSPRFHGSLFVRHRAITLVGWKGKDSPPPRAGQNSSQPGPNHVLTLSHSFQPWPNRFFSPRCRG